MANIRSRDSLTITAWLCERTRNGQLNGKRLGRVGNHPDSASGVGDVAGVRASLVCRRWRELSRLLLGNYGRVL